jgi:hypothetical protein
MLGVTMSEEERSMFLWHSRRRVIASLIVVASMACGTSSGSPKSGYVNVGDVALKTYASVLCQRFQRCTPDLLQSSFGDIDTCNTRMTDASSFEFTGLGTTVYSSQLDACSEKLQAADCNLEGHDLTAEAHSFIPECIFKGTVADGGSCTSSAQCTSGSCFKAQGQTTTNYCGVCSARVPMNGDCSAANCEGGLACMNKKCIVPSNVGGPCSFTQPCAGVLLCVGGTCQKPLGSGETCDPDVENVICDLSKGLRCLPTAPGSAVKGKCAAVSFLKVGEPCGFDAANAKLTLCLGSSCTSDNNGKCVPDLQEGAACSDQQSIECAFPLACIGAVCARTDQASCQ